MLSTHNKSSDARLLQLRFEVSQGRPRQFNRYAFFSPHSMMDKLKEKILEHIVALVFLLITFLIGTIWLSVPPETRTQIGAAIPKQTLAATLGLLLILLLTSFAYIYHLRKTIAQPTQANSNESVSQKTRVEKFKIDNDGRLILKFLAQTDRSVSLYDLEQRLPITSVKLNYLVREMHKHRFLKVFDDRGLGYFYCELEQNGREYILKNKLLPS